MTRTAALALMIGAVCCTAMSQQAAEFSSYYSGNRYDFRLTQKQLMSTPAWLEDEENPPLSPRIAQTAALNYLRTLFDDATAWKLEEMKLVPVTDRWVYVVAYTPPTRDCQDCMVSPFSVVVTMDGNPVAAAVSRWKPPTPSADK